MQEFKVSPEQAQILSRARDPMVVVNEQGQMLGHLTPASSTSDRSTKLSAGDLAEIQRRMQSPAPGLTTAQVLSYLQSLETA
jgi:hypothetical protein